MSASTARHETRALLRAHLAAASDFRHLTRHCPVCHRLLRLAMEPPEAPEAPRVPQKAPEGPEPPEGRERPSGAPDTAEDESPAPT
ncbi:DUF6274 family protein [Streptomyces sp. NBC_00654]|uniref:DUF6274 family protein n=1 Tax=Streptomyces sp. NBC_00654 TaxID=2975799 RepID=UPI002255530C|nr:DUF6274 family protein [Streptomyces sp. NBC_00654]MCX4970424.1 DUF6274 family protein [Streptomyces sp. NBC_00654]